MNGAAMANAAKGASGASGAMGNAMGGAGNALGGAGNALGGASGGAGNALGGATGGSNPLGGATSPAGGAKPSTSPAGNTPGQSSSPASGKAEGATGKDTKLDGGDGQAAGGAPGEGGEPPKEKKIVDEQKAAHSQGEAPEGSKKGDKLGDGKEVDENGQIQDSSTKKTAKAAGRVVARVYGGEAGGQAADAICASKIGDKVIGTAADVADKTVPGLKQASDELEKAGAADGVNDALDTYEKFKSGDIAGGIEAAKKTKEDLKKTKKYVAKKILIGLLITFGPFLLLILIVVVAVTGAEEGGIIDQNGNQIGELSDEDIDSNLQTGEDTGEGETGGGSTGENLQLVDVPDEQVRAACAAVPGYNTYSTKRKGMIAASERAIRSHIPYLWGGKPKGPGIAGIKTGLDCSGFVQWAMWTGTGSKPGTLGTSTMVSNIGVLFEEISCNDLKPGDIGLKHKSSGSNHTGVYAGNGQWYHSPQTGQYIKKSSYKNFKVCLRVKGIDD